MRYKTSSALFQPVVCLLLWAIALQGNPAREFLEALGVTKDEVESMTGGMEPELAEMRQLRIAAALFDRERLGQLLRARLAEMLMQCHRPGELAQLAKAAQRLPAWAFDGNAAAPEVAHNNKRARTQAGGAHAHTPARHTHTRAGADNGAPLGSSFGLPQRTLVGELNALMDEVKRLDEGKGTLADFSPRDLATGLAGFAVPVDVPTALHGKSASAGGDESDGRAVTDDGDAGNYDGCAVGGDGDDCAEVAIPGGESP